MSTAITVQQTSMQPVIDLVLNAVSSQHTKVAYGRALKEFLEWHRATGQAGLTKAIVQAHVTDLRAQGKTASSINQRLTAIRKLAYEAADNGRIDHSAAQAISRVEGVRQEGKRLGNWLNLAQAQQLINLPDATTVKGQRDRAILAVLLGCGLRRAECAGLTLAHVQQRDGRWVIVDLIGKRSKIRSVPMPSWAKSALDAWLTVSSIKSGPVFIPIKRGGHVQAGQMTPQSIFDVVYAYATTLGIAVRPHDLRRTFAHLTFSSGAPVEQIQLTLGHESLQTTERYIGVKQDLAHAPCDLLALTIG